MKPIIVILSIVLVLHGLIHLIGTTVYMKLKEIPSFSYKTTLLGGRWDVGNSGIRLFGNLWMVPVVGFIVAALALLAGWAWGLPVLVAVTVFSLILTALDWKVAYAGAVIDIIILAVVLLVPQIAGLFAS